jgi:hypothetical protein
LACLWPRAIQWGGGRQTQQERAHRAGDQPRALSCIEVWKLLAERNFRVDRTGLRVSRDDLCERQRAVTWEQSVLAGFLGELGRGRRRSACVAQVQWPEVAGIDGP